MKRCLDNQINASFIDISRIKWLAFYCGRLSSAQLVPLQAQKHRPIIGPHPVKQTAFQRETSKTMDINPSLQICRWNVNGIGCGQEVRQKSSFIDGSAFSPGAPKRVPSDSEKHMRVYTSSHVCHSHEWRIDTATGKTLKKTECVLRRPPIGGRK